MSSAAVRAGQYGLKTAIIEKDAKLGGTCLHVGCIPTKALLFNAELWDHLKEAKEFGIEGVDSRKLNWAAVQERKGKIVAKHAKGLEFLMKKNKVETIKGYGKLTGPAQNGVFTVELTNDGKSTHLKTKNVILATGSEARMLPGLEALAGSPNVGPLLRVDVANADVPEDARALLRQHLGYRFSPWGRKLPQVVSLGGWGGLHGEDD